MKKHVQSFLFAVSSRSVNLTLLSTRRVKLGNLWRERTSSPCSALRRHASPRVRLRQGDPWTFDRPSMQTCSGCLSLPRSALVFGSVGGGRDWFNHTHARHLAHFPHPSVFAADKRSSIEPSPGPPPQAWPWSAEGRSITDAALGAFPRQPSPPSGSTHTETSHPFNHHHPHPLPFSSLALPLPRQLCWPSVPSRSPPRSPSRPTKPPSVKHACVFAKRRDTPPVSPSPRPPLPSAHPNIRCRPAP